MVPFITECKFNSEPLERNAMSSRVSTSFSPGHRWSFKLVDGAAVSSAMAWWAEWGRVRCAALRVALGLCDDAVVLRTAAMRERESAVLVRTSWRSCRLSCLRTVWPEASSPS